MLFSRLSAFRQCHMQGKFERENVSKNDRHEHTSPTLDTLPPFPPPKLICAQRLTTLDALPPSLPFTINSSHRKAKTQTQTHSRWQSEIQYEIFPHTHTTRNHTSQRRVAIARQLQSDLGRRVLLQSVHHTASYGCSNYGHDRNRYTDRDIDHWCAAAFASWIEGAGW